MTVLEKQDPRVAQVRKFLSTLIDRGMSLEQIAAKLDVSYSSIYKWMSDKYKRTPKKNMIKYMELVFGEKIL